MTEKRAPLFGVQPVLEALRSDRRIAQIYLARGEGGATARVREEAERRKIAIRVATKEALTARAGHDRHQGVLAELAIDSELAPPDSTVADILEDAKARGEEPLLLLLDQIQDPQNLGALIRSAYALGAHGVVIPRDRAASVTPAVVRVSAGAALHMRVARVTNLKHALTELAEAGVWSAAGVLGGQPVHEARLDGPLALVIGSEGKGVRPTLAAACDLQVAIPLSGRLDSLNASVAGGILLYEALRQRGLRSA